MKSKNTIILYSFVVFFTFSSCADSLKTGKQPVQVSDQSPVAILLETTLKDVNDSNYLFFQSNELFTSLLIKEFYKLNKNYPIWTSSNKPNRLAIELITLFGRAQYYGLDSSFYNYSQLKDCYIALIDGNEPDINKKAMEFELAMTHNCFKFMSHLRSGILYADTSIYGYNMSKYPANFPEKLNQFVNNNSLTSGILDMQPKSYEYRRLIKGLEQFLGSVELSKHAFLMPDPATDSVYAYQKAHQILVACNYIKPTKQSWARDEFISHHLYSSGPNANINDTEFSFCSMEEDLFIEALKRFQKDHGLSPDGKIGYNTVKALLNNNRDRFEQIAINLERLRWEKNRPARYVYVNLPSYKLRVVDNHQIKKTFIVVVGAQATETPLLNSQIEYFITNPEWNVPYSITSNEILPKLKKDSTYLARHNFRLYDKERNPVKQINWSEIDGGNFNYSIQQSAGGGSALGKIKFIFPNPYNVYIHDTQDKSKFTKDIRAYSHGCMRIKDPNEFAKTLLGLEPGNMADSVDVWLLGSERRKINLPESIPVYVRYVTCEADSNGEIIFYQDIYGRDNKLKSQIFK